MASERVDDDAVEKREQEEEEEGDTEVNGRAVVDAEEVGWIDHMIQTRDEGWGRMCWATITGAGDHGSQTPLTK